MNIFVWEWWQVTRCPKKINTLYKTRSRYDAVKQAVTNNCIEENQTLFYNSPDFSLLDDLGYKGSNKNKVCLGLQNKWHSHMRFRKIISMIILHNSSSSAWSRLRTSSTAFCTAVRVADLSYSAAVNSMILAGSCVPCSDKKKEYSRKRIIAAGFC